MKASDGLEREHVITIMDMSHIDTETVAVLTKMNSKYTTDFLQVPFFRETQVSLRLVIK